VAERACKQLIASQDGKWAIFIDTVNSAEIIEYLNRSPKHRKKFQYIARLILEGIRNTETYDWENINDRC